MANKIILMYKDYFYYIYEWFSGQKYDDDEDFIFCSDSDSSHKTPQNLAIILGPSGCGKTSAVYAVANEINANVISLLIFLKKIFY